MKTVGKKRRFLKWLAAFLAVIILGTVAHTGYIAYRKTKVEPKSDLKYVFVHGLSGWGSYDAVNKVFPYWGLSGGDLIQYLNLEGYDCYAASVAPSDSAWDRACELYAQLEGTVVDYGKEHSERCHHERFGTDFSDKPLLEDFDNSKIVLIGHSFGGATIRLFSEILVNGSKAEQEATPADELSGFFKEGNKDQIFAMVTLAAPSNGTTAYDLNNDKSFDASAVEVPEKYIKLGKVMAMGTKAEDDGRIADDHAAYDMHIDNAMEMNRNITTFDNTYYFAYSCSVTTPDKNGVAVPDSSITEALYMRSAILMGHYTGKTAGGYTIDDSWLSNDGLVNTVSAKTPSSAPGKAYSPDEKLESGIWYEMPTITGDHMYFQGGMTKRVKIRPFYNELLQMITSLEKQA